MTVKKIERALCSPLFLTIAILETVAFAAGCVTSDFNVISLLICIGMWIVYGVSRSGKLTENQTGIKMISGTVKASYIITWVGIGFLVVGAVIMMAVGPGVINIAEDLIVKEEGNIAEYFDDSIESKDFDEFSSELDEFSSGLNDAFGSETEIDLDISDISGGKIADIIIRIVRAISDSAYIIFAVLGIIMLLCAVGWTLINIFFTGNLHKLTKSACLAVANGDGEIQKIGTIKIWFLVLGILSALSALGNMLFPILAIPSGCKGAAYIIAYILLDRFEKEKEPQPIDTTPEQL